MRGSEIRETEGRNTLITNCCSVVLLYIFTINMYEKTYTLYTARHQTEEAGEWNRKGLWLEGKKELKLTGRILTTTTKEKIGSMI